MPRHIRRAFAAAFALACLAVDAKTPADTFVVAANMSQMITHDPAAINESFTAGFMRNVCDPLVRPQDDPRHVVVLQQLGLQYARLDLREAHRPRHLRGLP
jgi:hypothetical protein